MDSTASAADRLARSRFQSGLLAWLRAAAPREHADGLREMIAVTRHLAERAEIEGSALLWRSAGSFLQALLDGSLTSDDASRALCRRIEKYLAGRKRADGAQIENCDAITEAIFAFVSDRRSPPDLAQPKGNSGRASLNTLLGGSLSATADVLPLLGNAKQKRFSDEQVACWKEKVAALRDAWHAAQIGEQSNCRAAATSLIQTALDLSDAASLRIADALADAAAATEDPRILKLPGFRAAFSAALEASDHPEGPDRGGFDERATTLAIRLKNEADTSRVASALVCPSAPWFAEDAREILSELTVALDAVPPNRQELLTGFDWFAQHESARFMAIRGLATTAHKVITLVRSDDLDLPETHKVFVGVIEALSQAIEELAGGNPPKSDEAIFSVLRALETSFGRHRLQPAAVTHVKRRPDAGKAPL